MLKTSHHIISSDSRKMNTVEDLSVDLIVTSPPYPMIAMWDDVFGSMNSEITPDLIASEGNHTFDLMHLEMDKVWLEVDRVLKPGGMVCVNIGDATRTIMAEFRLYPNHSRIIESFTRLGFSNLPNIIWKKPTNAPNKFMGSGTLPVGAYVTLEHEFILMFRKNAKREFATNTEKAKRKESAFFWEERNRWFSDTWDLKGTGQKLDNQNRNRSAAFPFEIPHRLINMYSLIGDTVLDPFNGTGTTTKAAIANARNSIGVDIDPDLNELVKETLPKKLNELQSVVNQRIQKHRDFLNIEDMKPVKHHNKHYDFPVKTRQETMMCFPVLESLSPDGDFIQANYK